MNNKIKGLIFETVSEVLLEGRLEDVKAKYPEDKASDIDRLSQGDPSGNNKYLAWMANQYINVGGMTLDQLTDIVKRFHSEQARINTTMSKEIVESNPQLYPGREARRVSNNPKDISSYGTLAGLSKVVEAAEENQPSSSERDKIYQDEKWTVIVPKTHQASCKYGVHSNWCVSTSNSYYYKNYTESGMLAFVLWRGKQEGQMALSKEGEYKVAAYVRFERPDYKNWEWYNKKDTRMDNDLPISIFPPALIKSIQDHLKKHMKESGYLVEIDENELNEKTHLLQIYGNEGRRKFITMLKPGEDISWLDKYNRRNSHTFSGIKSNDWSQKLVFVTISEPNGELSVEFFDLNNLYRMLKNNPSSWRSTPASEIFNRSLPYGVRDILSDEKKQEVFDFTKDYFSQNYKGYLQVESRELQIGDYVRWERATRRDRNRLGRYRQGKIIRQTPSGYFVVDVEGEDKPARFKPDYGKYMDKRYEPDNLDMSVWDYVPQQN